MKIIEFNDVVTYHNGWLALNHLNLDIKSSEVHALIGERHAGKTSVIRVLSGTVPVKNGEVIFEEKRISRFSPRVMLKNGIHIFHQSHMLIPSLSSWENILAGNKSIGIAEKHERAKAEELILSVAARWSLRPDLRCPVYRLSGIEQAVIELTRVLSFNPKLLIFDEPSGRFTADEMQVLYDILADLRLEGKSILYAASSVDEILKVADRVSVMKAGHVADTQLVHELDRNELVNLAYSFSESREELVSKNIRLLKYTKYNEEIISNLPLGTVVLDEDGEVYLANKAARDIISTGKPEKKSMEDHHFILSDPLACRDLAATFGEEQLALFLKASVSGERQEWKQLPTNTGRFIDTMIFPFHDAEEHTLGAILTMEDISESKANKEYLVRAEQAASIAELSTGIVHEVNNPLGIISNYIELLLMRKQDDYTNERLRIISDEIKRIHGIMLSLLSFAHVGNDSMELCDLTSIAQESLTLLAYEAERRNVLLISKVTLPRLMARAAPARIKQVLINLLMNALDAALPGGTIVLRLNNNHINGYARFEIEDSGSGIDPALVDTLFTPFVSGKTGGSHAGLGLSVCKHIIDAHNGRIWCNSEPGKTIFFIELPLF